MVMSLDIRNFVQAMVVSGSSWNSRLEIENSDKKQTNDADESVPLDYQLEPMIPFV
jgi:hypothetical protein